jgi:type I restriction enzyme S subunit
MKTIKLTKKYETYPEYKDSGVEWLGEIPVSWESLKIVSVFDFPHDKVTEENYEPLSVTYGGIKKQIENAAKVAEGSLRKHVKIGDIVINGRSDRKGAVGMSEYEGAVSLVYNVLRKRKGDFNSKYFHYLFRSKLFSEEFYRWGRGIVDDLWTTRESEMKSIVITTPTKEEQARIAKYLDKKIVLIDQIIEKKQKQIGLLHEKRIAVINHMITKGIDLRSERNKNRLNWNEKIPNGWEIKKLKYVARFEYGESLASELRKDGKVGVYGSNGLVGFHEKANTFQQTIIIGRKGSYGAVNYSNEGVFVIDTAYYIDSRHTTENLKWLSYALGTLALNTLSQDTGVPGLSRSSAYEKFMLIPLPKDQFELVKCLDLKIGKYDAAIKNVEKSIEIIKEFKSSLISNVVTGKIKV